MRELHVSHGKKGVTPLVAHAVINEVKNNDYKVVKMEYISYLAFLSLYKRANRFYKLEKLRFLVTPGREWEFPCWPLNYVQSGATFFVLLAVRFHHTYTSAGRGGGDSLCFSRCLCAQDVLAHPFLSPSLLVRNSWPSVHHKWKGKSLLAGTGKHSSRNSFFTFSCCLEKKCSV